MRNSHSRHIWKGNKLMKYFNKFQGNIQCECGSTIDIDNEISEVKDDALSNGDGTEKEDVEVNCENCGSTYEIDINAYVEVTHEITAIRLKESACILTSESGVQYKLSSFSVGQEVEILDGVYRIGQYNYQVENGTLSDIHNALVTEDQLSLFAN